MLTAIGAARRGDWLLAGVAVMVGLLLSAVVNPENQAIELPAAHPDSRAANGHLFFRLSPGTAAAILALFLLVFSAGVLVSLRSDR